MFNYEEYAKYIFAAKYFLQNTLIQNNAAGERPKG